MSARKFFWLCLSICFLWTNLGFMLTLAINWGEIPGPPALRDSPVFYSDIINFCWIQSIPQNNVRIKHTCRAVACFMVLFTCDSFFFITGRFTFYRYCFGNWSWDREFNSKIIRASKTGKIVNSIILTFQIWIL